MPYTPGTVKQDEKSSSLFHRLFPCHVLKWALYRDFSRIIGVKHLKENILGVLFDDLTMQEAAQRGKEFLTSDTFHYVVTPNPEFLLAAEKDEQFRALLNGADLVLPDGIGVIYSAKLLGRPLKHLLRLCLRTGVGLAALAAFSPVGGLIGVSLGVNLANALVMGLLGVPGFGLLLMLHWALAL